MVRSQHHEIEMLRRFAEAGELGIEGRFVPLRIRDALERAGYITSGAVPRITETGAAFLNSSPEGEANG